MIDFEEWKRQTPIINYPNHEKYGWFHPIDYPTTENFERHRRGYEMYYWDDSAWVKRDDNWHINGATREFSCPEDPTCCVCNKTDAEKYLWHCSDIPTAPEFAKVKQFYEQKYADMYECVDCLIERVLPPNKL